MKKGPILIRGHNLNLVCAAQPRNSNFKLIFTAGPLKNFDLPPCLTVHHRLHICLKGTKAEFILKLNLTDEHQGRWNREALGFLYRTEV